MHFSSAFAAIALLGTVSALPGKFQFEKRASTTQAYTPSETAPTGPNCVDRYNTCRQPKNGVSANQSFCASDNAQCKSECEATFKACGVKYLANHSTCAAYYAECLGENPFVNSNTAPFPLGPSVTNSGPTASGTAPAGTGTTVMETEKVYTTTTVCPIVSTQWHGNSSTVITTSTTSTITVTSCPGGCHPTSTNPPITIVTPTTSSTEKIEDWFPGSSTVKTHTVPTEVTSTITSFVPCSTPVMSNSETTFFSTWLTVTYLTTTYKTLTTSCETLYPTPSTVQVSATTLPISTSIGVASGSCAAPETVYETVVSYVTVYGDHKTKTAASATNTPVQPGTSFSWSHSASASGTAKPTGWVKPSGYAKPSGH